MALTKVREIALFQILEVPYSTDYYNTITTYLTDHVYTDVALQTALEALLDKWIALGTRVDSLDNGNIGSLQNINYSVERERDVIRRHVSIIVPPYSRLLDDYTRSSISIIRG